MIDVQALRDLLDTLKSGRFGQRDIWIAALEQGIPEIEQMRKLLGVLHIELDGDDNTVIRLDGCAIVAVVASEEAIMLRAFESRRREIIAVEQSVQTKGD